MENAVAGIDIGGTKIRWATARGAERGRARATRGKALLIRDAGEIKTPHGQKQFEDAFSAICATLSARGIAKIGVSAAGIITGGALRKSPNLPALHNVRFAHLAPRGVTLRIDNDARCFARAETTRGRGRLGVSAHGGALALIFGTGVGRALVRNGTIVPLKRFERPETWEKEYQRRAKDPAPQLAEFLAPKIAVLLRETKAKTVILGGGRFRTKNLYPEIRKALHAATKNVRRSHFRQNAAAIGAALLF